MSFGISLWLIACGTRSDCPPALFDKAVTEVSEAQTPDEVISDFCSRVMCGDYIGGGRIGIYSRRFPPIRHVRASTRARGSFAVCTKLVGQCLRCERFTDLPPARIFADRRNATKNDYANKAYDNGGR